MSTEGLHVQASTGISRGPWPIVIGAVWDARGTEEIARAPIGVDSDLDILQRRRPWGAVACERHGKLQSAYSDDSDSTQAPGERPRYVNPPKDAPGVWLPGTNGRTSPGGHRSYRQERKYIWGLGLLFNRATSRNFF